MTLVAQLWIPSRMPGTDKPSEIDPDIILSVCFLAHSHRHHIPLASTVPASRVLPGLNFFTSAVRAAWMTFLTHFILVFSDFSVMAQFLYRFYRDTFAYCSAPSLCCIISSAHFKGHRACLYQGTCHPSHSYISVPLFVHFHERRSEALTGLQLTVFLA